MASFFERMGKLKTARKDGGAKRRGGGGNTRVSAADEGTGVWHSPVLLNLIADVLYLMGAILLIWAAVTAVQRLPLFPLTQVVVTRPLEQVSRSQLEQVARTAVVGNFFTVNLEAVQASLERLPWVRRVELRRRWPDGIEVTLEEHQSVARWTPREGEQRLVNNQGEVFVASTQENLPLLAGPEGSSAQMLERYRVFAGSMASIGRKPVSVALSARQAWTVRLDDGVVLELGREQAKAPLAERVARFTTYYPAVRHKLPGVEVVDMRYPNGFALKAHNKT